jgi:hypothetical protein
LGNVQGLILNNYKIFDTKLFLSDLSLIIIMPVFYEFLPHLPMLALEGAFYSVLYWKLYLLFFKQHIISINLEFVDFGQTRSKNHNISGLFGYTFICG